MKRKMNIDKGKMIQCCEKGNYLMRTKTDTHIDKIHIFGNMPTHSLRLDDIFVFS